MAKQATGHIRWFNGIATARIRITNDVRESFALSTCRTDDEAGERALLLADVAKRMRLAGIELEKARTALEMVATASPRHFETRSLSLASSWAASCDSRVRRPCRPSSRSASSGRAESLPSSTPTRSA